MSYQGDSAQIRPIGGFSSINDRLRSVSAISKVICLVCELIGFICSECALLTTKTSNFYSTVAMIAFLCTAIFLSLELYWPYTDAQRIIETKDVDLYLSAIGALMFMLISTLVTYHSYDNNLNAAAAFGYLTMIACCVNTFWRFKKITRNTTVPASYQEPSQA